ncbi:hypothetical protein ACHAWT_001164, partial [Skeletonema menzelii]
VASSWLQVVGCSKSILFKHSILRQQRNNAAIMSAATSVKSDTVNYLLLYEAMVRHQDLEFDATSDHIKNIVERIKTLGKPSPQHQQHEGHVPKGMITYRQMRRCLLRLGYTWNRCATTFAANNKTNAAVDNYYYDDDNISVISNNSSSTRASGGALSNTSGSAGGFGNVRDIIATDAQLIMLLTTLVEMEERYHFSSSSSEQGEEKSDGNVFPQGLFVAEFVQAYKLIIGGMQSLQTFSCPHGDGDTHALLQELRLRSRERTLGLIRLFGPDSSLYDKSMDIMPTNSSSTSLNQQSAGESPAGKSQQRRKNNDGLALTPNRSPKRSSNKDKIAKDGLLPRLTDAEIRKMVHSKDIALAKILEEHESEMNVMAVNMEELRLKNARTNAVLKKRKKRARLTIAVMTIFFAVGGGCLEYYKREQVKREIASGREEQRKAEEEMIAQLKDEIQVLKSKLGDAEATIRYEENRYEGIKKISVKNEKLLEEMEAKWKMESAELERCRVTRKELDAQVSTIKTKNEQMEEEVGWCRERLTSTERAMEGMERALSKKSRSVGGALNTTLAAITKIVEKSDDKVGGDENKEKNHKPLLMEMKYNKSFRNAVFLRQTYAGVAGVAASMLLQGLLPGVANVFRMIFLK